MTRRAPEMKQRGASNQDLLAAARFLRGDPQGADVRALNRVANYLERQLRTRERSKEKEQAKRRASKKKVEADSESGQHKEDSRVDDAHGR